MDVLDGDSSMMPLRCRNPLISYFQSAHKTQYGVVAHIIPRPDDAMNSPSCFCDAGPPQMPTGKATVFI